LEIGIGTGENFRHFPLNSNLHILDKTEIFLDYLKDSIKSSGRSDLTISQLVVNRAEDMKSIESNSMDAVVHTFTLCSVDDYSKVLNEIYRVLKPGGVCIFIEHSIEKEDKTRRLQQAIVQPLLGDCSFKDMRAVLNSGKYDKLVLRQHEISSIWLNIVNPMIYGYGIKL